MHYYRIFRLNYPALTSIFNVSGKTDVLVATRVSERDRDRQQDPYSLPQLTYRWEIL